MFGIVEELQAPLCTLCYTLTLIIHQSRLSTKYVKSILSMNIQTLQWGRENENLALMLYEAYDYSADIEVETILLSPVITLNCGIGVVEVKCPYSPQGQVVTR